MGANNMVSGNSMAGKSFQSFTVSEELLAKVAEAVIAGEKEARSSGNIQSFEVFYRGFRQNIVLGRIYIIPASICSDRKNFPTALLYGCLVRVFGTGGEELSDFIEKKIGESEFDEYSQISFDEIKNKLFGIGDGKFESFVLYAPAWHNRREYFGFHFTKDESQLKNNLRHQVFSAYYNPAVSSAFNAIMTEVDTTKLDVTDITPKLTYPYLTENLLQSFPNLQKQASNRKKIFLTRKTADAVTKEVLEPQEMDVFESLDQALTEAMIPGTEGVEEAGGRKDFTPPTDSKVPRVAGADLGKEAAIQKVAYVSHCPGHKNSKGELAEWCVKSHETGKILSSHGTEEAAKKHLQDMHAHTHSGSVKTAEYVQVESSPSGKIMYRCSGCGHMTPKPSDSHKCSSEKSAAEHGDWCDHCISKYHPEVMMGHAPGHGQVGKCSKCGRSAELRTVKVACLPPAAHETPFTNVGPGTAPAEKQLDTVKGVKESVELKAGDMPVGIAIDETGVPRRKEEEKKGKKADWDSFGGKSKHPGDCTDADVIASIDANKWGTATIPIDFGPRKAGIPSVKKAAQLDEFTRGYIDAALWSSTDDSDEGGGEPLDSNYDVRDISPQAMADIISVCRNFQENNRELLEIAAAEDGQDAAHQGHDFWLTRNGHGAGYWDGDYEETGDRLTEAAKQYGESDIYVGDDGKLYLYEDNGKLPKKDKSLNLQQRDLKFSSSEYVASKMAKMVDYDPYEAISPKAKKARDEQEAKLSKFRPKQAVELDIDSIWSEITEDMGPAPLIDLPEQDSQEGQGDQKRDGRPRKSDIGKLPEAFKSKEPEKDKAMSDPEAKKQEDSMPKSTEEKQKAPGVENSKSDKPFQDFIKKKKEAPKSEDDGDDEKPWHVSSKMADFVQDALGEMGEGQDDISPAGTPNCGECAMIGGIHEHGCPNEESHWNPELGKWEVVSEPEPRGNPDDDFFADSYEEFEDPEMNQTAALEVPNEEYQCQDCGHEGPTDTHGKCMACGSSSTVSVHKMKQADTADNEYNIDSAGNPTSKETGKSPTVECHENYDKQQSKGAAKKKADGIKKDFSEAKAETVNPDTVDKDIKQDTKSVSEAAKVGKKTAADKTAKTYASKEEEVRDLFRGKMPVSEIVEKTGLTTNDIIRIVNGPAKKTKTASDISGDIAEAKAEVASPDTVDNTIQQDTKSAEEAAKVGASYGRPARVDSIHAPNEKNWPEKGDEEDVTELTVQPTSLEDRLRMQEDREHMAAGHGGHEQPGLYDKQIDDEREVEEGKCPVCHWIDNEMIDTEEGKAMYCYHCEKVTWQKTDIPVNASAGDCMPEEVPFDFGMGDLGDIVLSEDDPGIKDDKSGKQN